MMYQFARIMDVPNREIIQECALLDSSHPPATRSMLDYVSESISSAGADRGGRLGP